MKVSVCIPVYNGEHLLARAVDSALNQGEDLEVILVDDASTDGTAEICRKYAETDSRIVYLRNDHSRGASGSRNRAVEQARGQYVAFLDADDMWAPGKLKKQLALLENTGSVLCCSARELMKDDGTLTGRVIHVPNKITYRKLLRGNTINCSSVVVRRNVALEFPMEHEDSHEDYITWLKILKKYGPAVGIDEPLLKYRLSAQGKSGSKLKSAGMTFKVYRYMGFGLLISTVCFVCYAVNGVVKYAGAFRHRQK